VTDPLAPLLADGVVEEVVSRLKSGKEADLWIVRHGGELVAAKVYKAREARSFRNDAVYREGRRVRNTRTQRAMDKGTRFGQAAAEEAWKTKEADALHALHAAGVRVPRPVMFYEGVLLMELVLDAHGHPAPRLVDAPIGRDEAAALYADLRAQAVRMLAQDLIHGDLSPYNVLVAWNGPVVIDFPQVVGAAHSSQAESFFRRDLENLRRFFAAVDPGLRSSEHDAREIWRAYVRRELTPDFVPAARPAQPHPSHHRPAPPHAPPSPPRSGARPQGRRGPDRRRGSAGPEVIHVSRAPHAPAPHAPVPHPQHRPSHGGDAQRPAGGGSAQQQRPAGGGNVQQRPAGGGNVQQRPAGGGRAQGSHPQDRRGHGGRGQGHGRRRKHR
jgi:RIO kinase 1